MLQGAKIRYMFGGKAQVPMVLRMPAGSGTGAAAQHSESLESWLVNVPGLKVVAPSTPYDAKGLLLAAIADDNPVMFVENKLLYKIKGPVPGRALHRPAGQGRRPARRARTSPSSPPRSWCRVRWKRPSSWRRKGSSSRSSTCARSSRYDAETIIASVKKTGRLLMVHEAPLIGGFGGEIVAMIAQSQAFAYLEAPIVRLGGADVPIPYNPKLEKAAVPAGRKHRRGRTPAGEQPDLVERDAWSVSVP